MSRTTCRGTHEGSTRTRRHGTSGHRGAEELTGCEADTIDHPDQPGALTGLLEKTADPVVTGRVSIRTLCQRYVGRGKPETRRIDRGERDEDKSGAVD
jgi:hypothetical protein